MVLKAAVISAQLLMPYEGIWQFGVDPCDITKADTIVQIYDNKMSMVTDKSICLFDYIAPINGELWKIGARCYKGESPEPLHYNFSMSINGDKLYIIRNNTPTSILTKCE